MMYQKIAFALFQRLIDAASNEIARFTIEQQLSVDYKADRTAVTQCDRHLGELLARIAAETGLPVVHEEDESTFENIRSGNYIIIDPIDGTRAYIRHVEGTLKRRLKEPDASPVVDPSLESETGEHDYAMLVGIVIGGKPLFGCSFNYVTGEKIFTASDGTFEREGRERKGLTGKDV